MDQDQVLGRTMIWRGIDALVDEREVTVWVDGLAEPLHVKEIVDDNGVAVLVTQDSAEHIVRASSVRRIVSALPDGVRSA